MTLWQRYLAARNAFVREPSPRNEGRVIAAYAEWARLAHPPHVADELISLACRHFAAEVEASALRQQ